MKKALFIIGGNLETVCKIIRTPCRYIPDGRLKARLHHACHNLVECPIPAAAHHQLITFVPPLRVPRRVTQRAGRLLDARGGKIRGKSQASEIK